MSNVGNKLEVGQRSTCKDLWAVVGKWADRCREMECNCNWVNLATDLKHGLLLEEEGRKNCFVRRGQRVVCHTDMFYLRSSNKVGHESGPRIFHSADMTHLLGYCSKLLSNLG